jgi:MSHA biogenesis protein MshL
MIIRKYLITTLLLLTLSFLTSCKTHQPVNGTAIDEMNVTLQSAINQNKRIDHNKGGVPSRISNELLSRANYKNNYYSQENERRFDIAVKDVAAKTFFMGLVKGTSISMAVSPEVKGTITLNLKNVTVLDVLKTLEDVYG